MSKERVRQIAILGGKASRGGFSKMPKEKVKMIASLGGKASHGGGRKTNYKSKKIH